MCRPTRDQHLRDRDVELDNDAAEPMFQHLQVIQVGRDEHVGDPLMIPRPQNTFRILAKNPNGISLGDGGNLHMTLEDLEHAQVNLFLASETKLDSTHDWVQSKVTCQCRSVFAKKFKVVMGSSKVQYPGQHKPGGVMALLTGNAVGRVQSMGEDSFGRWVYIKLNGGDGKVITVIATYQVCQGNVQQSGPTTALTQQYSMLEQAKRQDPHRVRWHHSKDLVQFVQECQDAGELIVLGGDFNETLGDYAGGLTRLCSQCNLRNPVEERHGHVGFSTHIKGHKCIDYLLVDAELLPSVTASGYEAFNVRIVSDHRGVYIDVDESLFFGNKTRPPVGPPTRVYNSKNPKLTMQYFDHLDSHLVQHSYFQRIKDLETCIATGIPNHQLAESLDKRRIAACQYTENRLQRYPQVPYSPELRDMRNITRYLKAVIQCLAHPGEEWDDIMSSHRSKLELLGMECPDTLEACRQCLKEHLKTLKATEKEERRSQPNRTAHQEKLIKEYTDSNTEHGSEMAKVLQRMMRAEATSAVFRQCAHARGLNKEGGLTYVEVPADPEADPKQCQDWRRVDDPVEVEEAIRQRLKTHFSQARDCNLTSEPFDTTMLFSATCDRADQILTGTIDTSQMDDMTAALLDCFSYARGEGPAVAAHMEEEEFLGKIKVWLERTSTSPITNVHLGHAKAYVAWTPVDPETEEGIKFVDLRNKSIAAHLTLLNYALHFGYTFERWRSIVNGMLEKDPGRPKIHRLRVIHLYEWDFNLILCVKWRKLLHHICDNNLVNPACYGTMPGHSSLDPVFVRELEYEITRFTRRPLVHFDNDATSCYDRIPCFLANLASRKYGMHKNVCIVQARTLEHAKYYLRTKLGISKEYAQHTRECPWFGTGQGSGNSPFYWLLISSTLYDLYCSRTEGTAGGATYVSPDKSLQTTIHLLGFVDDVNNRTNLRPSVDTVGLDETLQQLLAQASQDSQLWHDILTASNQELELTKCKYHVIHYQFKDTGAPVMVDAPTPPAPLRITGKQGQVVAITHVQNSKAIKYLGCLKSPMNQQEQMLKLQEQCDDYARVVNCSRLSPRGTQVFYQAIYRLSVGYPLPMCYFSLNELNRIQKKSHKAMLAGCGFNRNTNKAVVFGPAQLGGLEFFHLYDEQGYGQVTTFMKFWRSPNTHPGELLRISVAWAQYCAGTSWSILADTTTALPHLESSWLASMRMYLNCIDATMELDTPYTPALQCVGDTFIMDAVLTSHSFKPYQVRMVNYCRLYLRVTTLADITTAKGDAIDPGMFHGLDTAVNVNNRWYHVHQKRPGPKAWACWRKACRLFAYNDKKLMGPLGNWTVAPGTTRRHYQFWFDPTMPQWLYRQRVDGTFTSHSKMRMDYDQIPTAANVVLPERAVPVDVIPYYHGTWGIVRTYRKFAVPPAPQDTTHETLVELIQTLPPWERSLLQNLEFLGGTTQQDLFDMIQTEGLFIGSDGSQEGHRASFAWYMSDQDGTRLIRCNGPCYGLRPTSYRAEGYGLLSVCRLLYHLRTHFQLNLESCSIYCDNKSMVKKCQGRPAWLDRMYPNDKMAAEWDLLMEIWRSLEIYDPEMAPTFTHVKGHQDEKMPYAQLPLSAQLNVDADQWASQFIRDNPDIDYHQVYLLPHAGVQLQFPTGTLTSQYKRALREARTTPALRESLKSKYGWTDEIFDDVNWEAMRLALRRLKGHRITLLKHINNISPVGKLVHTYDPKYPQSCPSCEELIETRYHLYECSGVHRLEWRRSFYQKLAKELSGLNTMDSIRELLVRALKAMIEGEDVESIAVPEGLEELAAAQSAIGWRELFKGRLSNQWAHHQQEYLGSYDRMKNGHTWSIKVAQTILEGWLELWQSRNLDRHGRDSQSKAQLDKDQAVRELEMLYGYQGQILARHDWILATPLEHRRNLKTYQLRAFISNYKPILEESYQERLATG